MELPLKELRKICKKYHIKLMVIFGSFISHHFNNPDGGVKIINGHHSRVKLLKVGNN
jgi:predicted nucleotidyltransferase